MKILIKKTLDEFIFISSKWSDLDLSKLTLIKKAIDKSNAKDIYICISSVLTWAKEVVIFSEIDEDDLFTENYFFIDNQSTKKYQYNRFKILFDNCPEVSEFLKLEDGKVGFSDHLTVEERKEIHQYIHANYQMELRWRERKD
jgi:hypothetical protein